MKKAVLIALFCLTAFVIEAQQNFFGRISDSTGLGLEFVTVAILNTSDSSLVQSTLTDVKGIYNFSVVPSGEYILKSFVIGYAENYSLITVNENTKELPNIILKTKGINLNEVSITAIKKSIEFKNGNITVNIEDSPLAAGNSVYDLLFKLPGVTVDEDDNILIQGRSGVKVMIDDRVQQMSNKQLINLLKGLNASNIEKIEILKNPPVKYDASGTGGMINIRTKKIKLTGTSGSVSYNYSQGFYAYHIPSISLNHKSKKLAFFSNFGLQKDKTHHDHHFNKKIVYDSFTSEMDQRMNNNEGGKFYHVQAGLDWYINKKNTIGVKVNSDGGLEYEDNKGATSISDTALGYNQLEFYSYMPNPWHYSNYNFNAEHLFDTLGTKFVFSVDYAPNYDIYDGKSENNFLDNSGKHVFQPFNYTQSNTITCNVLTSKADLQKVFAKGLILEGGVKGSDLIMVSDYNLKNQDNVSGNFILDTNFSNKFSYSEQLSGAYLNAKREVGKFNLQAGLRGENTHILAKNRTGNANYTRNYFNLFPVGSIEFNPNENNSLQLNYNKRINRPNYNSFNPYKSRSSIFMANMGNPYVLPEYSNTIELSHTYKGVLSNAISYENVKNYQLDLTLQNDSTRETIAYVQNLDRCFEFAYSLFFQNEITKWWMISFNGSASYSEYFGNINGLNYYSRGYFSIANLTSTFLVKKKTKIELNGKYIGPRYIGVWYNYPRWAVSLALKRSFLNEKLNVVVGVDDIFFTMQGNNQIKLPGQDWKITATNDSRRFKVAITYIFGKTKVEERDVSSNSEEKGRLGK